MLYRGRLCRICHNIQARRTVVLCCPSHLPHRKNLLEEHKRCSQASCKVRRRSRTTRSRNMVAPSDLVALDALEKADPPYHWHPRCPIKVWCVTNFPHLAPAPLDSYQAAPLAFAVNRDLMAVAAFSPHELDATQREQSMKLRRTTCTVQLHYRRAYRGRGALGKGWPKHAWHEFR